MREIHYNVLPHETLQLLKKIQKIRDFRNFYLVGGTALALYLGHRKSDDLDLFSQTEFTTSIVHKLPDKSKVLSLHDNSIELEIDNAKLFFFYFAYPLYKEVIMIESIRLADPVDIGLMKLLSLQRRTTRKDIIDLFFIDKEIIPLDKLLLLFEKHFPKDSFNSYDSLKRLIDPDELQSQPMLKMLVKYSWRECLETVEKKISEHMRKELH